MKKQEGKSDTQLMKNLLIWWKNKEENWSFVGINNLQNLAKKTRRKTGY